MGPYQQAHITILRSPTHTLHGHSHTHTHTRTPPTSPQDTLGSRQACLRVAEKALRAGNSVIVDRCNFDAKQLRSCIFGGHVASYMKLVAECKEENPDQNTTMFSQLSKAVKPAELENMYKKVHTAIRADPTKRVPRKNNAAGRKNYATKRISVPERRAKVAKTIQTLRKKLKA